MYLHVLVNVSPPELRHGARRFLLLRSGLKIDALISLRQSAPCPAPGLVHTVNVSCAEGSESLTAKHPVPEHEGFRPVGSDSHPESHHRFIPCDLQTTVARSQSFGIGLRSEERRVREE